MIRVCIVRQTYYPHQRNLRRNAEALVSQGYQVDVICQRRKGQKSRETMNGVNIYRLPLEHHRGKVFTYFFDYASFFLMVFFKLGWLSLRKQYQVVEVESMPDFLVFATLVPRLLGARIILYMFENIPALFASTFGVGPNHFGVRMMRLMEKASARYAHRVVVSDGEPYKQVLESRGIPSEKITVVLNVPDENVFSIAPPAIPVDGDAFRVIVLSNLLHRYGVQTVIRAIPLLVKEIPHLEVDLVGSGEYLPELKELARKLGVEEYLHITGWKPQEEVPSYIARADVAVAPMLADLGLPNKLFDYFAMGKPCVVSALPSLQVAFDGNCVLFFNPGNETELAARIQELYHDPQLRASLGAQGRDFYNRYRWPVTRNEYLKVYKKCLSL